MSLKLIERLPIGALCVDTETGDILLNGESVLLPFLIEDMIKERDKEILAKQVIPYGNLMQIAGHAMALLTDEQIKTFCGDQWKEIIKSQLIPGEMEIIEED